MLKNDDERQKAVGWLSEQGRQQRGQEVIDLYWSLLNSAEFRWNHQLDVELATMRLGGCNNIVVYSSSFIEWAAW